jgi:hypothetical protein
MFSSTRWLSLLRVVWALLAVVDLPAFAGALDGRSGAVQVVAALGLWTGWVTVLVATLVPSPASLTIVRLLTPGAVGAAVVAAVTGASAVAATAAIALGLVAAIVAGTAEVGWVFVQAGAYGDETRFLLRPPGPLVAGPVEVAWLVLAGTAGAGPLLLAARAWLAGVLVTAAAIALAVVLGPRFHRLALRWFVFVPAGVVVRDPLVLADTAMFRRADVRTLTLALTGTTATDLTARALGPAVEVDLAGTGTIATGGPFGDAPDGRSVAINAFLISPSRPGRVLAEAERRDYATTPPPSTSSSVGS